MKRIGSVVLVLAAVSSAVAGRSEDADLEKKARSFVEALRDGRFEEAAGTFDETMRGAMPADRLRATFRGLERNVGSLAAIESVRVDNVAGFRTGFVTCRFERMRLDVKIVFDSEGRITGLWFVPPPAAAPKTPDPETSDAFSETEVEIGVDPWVLPGTLTVPKGAGPFPAAVLVHGSGPHDRDETIGPNRPFRDLAHGLSARGVAVLRYEKRTRHYASELAALGTITVDEETADDAVAAVRRLMEVDRVDPRRIVVVGHSLGGFVAPRIAERAPSVAGLVILAANTRPIATLLVEQVEYLVSLDGEVTEAEKSQLAKMRAIAARIQDPELDPETPAAELAGAPGAYWIDLRAHDPVAAAREFEGPMLILQGERDYQVTLEDFRGWKEGLAGRDGVTFRSYPALNHLFVAGEGKPRPAEYQKAGRVAPEVIEDIARWIDQSVRGDAR